MTRPPPMLSARRRDASRVPAGKTVARDAVKLLAYAMLLRPWLYGIPNAIPQLQLGATRYTPDIHLEGYNGVLAAMALTMLPRLDALNEARRQVAARLDDGLARRGRSHHRAGAPRQSAGLPALRVPGR